MKDSLLDNPAALVMVGVMLVLLLVIIVLANVFLGLVKLKAASKNNSISKTLPLLLLLLTAAPASLFAQDAAPETAVATTSALIAGMDPVSFWALLFVLLLELVIVMYLLLQIKALLRPEAIDQTVPVTRKSFSLATWWGKMNSFKPVEQEADIDLGHDYDGIRELDNRLPPWWLYGFYITIIASVIYLWRFEVSHSGPSSKEEYERSVAAADIAIKAYLEKKGESVDENSVTMLTDAADMAAGKKSFDISCVACHKADGGGSVGPNLTDDYWMHGGDLKSIFKTIRYGINAMPPWQNSYSNKQIAQLASYVKSLHGTNPPDAKAPQGDLYKEGTGTAGSDSTATASDSPSPVTN